MTRSNQLAEIFKVARLLVRAADGHRPFLADPAPPIEELEDAGVPQEAQVSGPCLRLGLGGVPICGRSPQYCIRPQY